MRRRLLLMLLLLWLWLVLMVGLLLRVIDMTVRRRSMLHLHYDCWLAGIRNETCLHGVLLTEIEQPEEVRGLRARRKEAVL